ncbi:MAG: endonuclease VII domain-containing protein [Rickettsiales bacterium]|nr:endonuclease VII domain-containing protein [Rickettsiales bacterium]
MKGKICTKCGCEKPISYFHKMRDTKRSDCKECRNSYLREWSRKNPEKKREQKYRTRYGITLKQYEELLALQNHTCAICGKGEHVRKNDKYFLVDHCHKTGEVRGLLCHRCNQAIAQLNEDPSSSLRLIKYIFLHKIKEKEYADSFFAGYMNAVSSMLNAKPNTFEINNE